MINEFLAEFVTLIFGAFGWIIEIWAMVKDILWPSTYEKTVKGHNVLLVGSGDIGLELAKSLAERGARIAFWDVDQSALDKINKEFPKKDNERLITQRVDVRKWDEVQEAAKKLWTQHKYDVDILLNTAGVAHIYDSFDEEIDQIDAILDINVKGMVYVVRTFMPKFFERRRGHIITIASLAGQIGCPHICEYSASKHAVVGYMDSISIDALARGFHELEFTTLSPGFTATKMALNTKYSTVPQWSMSSIEDAKRELLRAILQNKRHFIFPWQARLAVAFKYILPYEQMHRFLARRWMY